MSSRELQQMALAYHQHPTPGKLGISITKPTDSQHDLSLAYTPGVAEPVKAIVDNPALAYQYTSKNHLVAVISNGSAVLGLGDVGAIASKPVMEGKAILFKRFADIDVFDIEVDAQEPQAFIDTVVRISPTFGGINLEDIKAPECFIIESALSEQLDIPVFHDDQHGTAITVCAGLLNALELQNKSLSDAVIVCAGAGAAGIASMHLLIAIGATPENIYMVDSRGVLHHERTDLNEYKRPFAVKTDKKDLSSALRGADVFIGVAQADILSPDMLKSMAKNPIVFALSNPNPEIQPQRAHEIRQDLIMATGRSDYPNQINNVLCFPYIFRGALQVKAKEINHSMKTAAIYALRDLAKQTIPDSIKYAYPGTETLEFGKQYIIPKPLDPRLRDTVTQAVIQAAKDSAVATH